MLARLHPVEVVHEWKVVAPPFHLFFLLVFDNNSLALNGEFHSSQAFEHF